MKYLLNFLFILYVKLSSILYRFIVWCFSNDARISLLIKELAAHSKDTVMNTTYIKPFNYKIMLHIPNKVLNILVNTEGLSLDVIFLLRLYKTIINIPEFITLGEVKLVLICTHGSDIFTFASQFSITTVTTPQDFVTHLYTGLMRLGLRGYGVDKFDMLMVKTITGDNDKYMKDIFETLPINNQGSYSLLQRKMANTPGIHSRSYSTSRNISEILEDNNPKPKDGRRFILPLTAKEKQMVKIAAFDIETMVYEGRLYPYAIAIQYNKYNKTRAEFFYYENIYDSVEANSSAMLEKMVKYMTQHCKNYAIFAHNLGKFDGILMMSPIFKVLGPHSVMISKDNRIITIKFKGVKLLDSMRIFPMSLEDLATEFGSNTQKGTFDHRKVNVNNVTTNEIKSEVFSYLKKDIASLHECMMIASDVVFNKYNINITDVYSTSSLAMKHFRTSYLDKEGIPLLPRFIKEVITNSYYGGISQVYKTYGQNLHYYDVNSLYPWAMTQDMPYQYLGIDYKAKLKDSFGFARASIYVPEDLNYKPLPVRIDDTLTTPSGHILGEYFSEELKYAESIGCTVTIHKLYKFSRKQIFNKYVEDLYREKAESKGVHRIFVKLLLNGLYGFFARTDEKYIALFLPIDEAIKEMQIYPAYNFMVLDDEKTALIIRESQPSKELCEATKHDYYDHVNTNNADRTKSNRAIAAAITAYSRVRIHQFKDICGDIYYSDTDSIISGNKLSDEFINNKLGGMKDEFKGQVINEAIFISPKLYGLRLKGGKEVIKARGVPEGTLSFDDLLRIHKGETIEFKRNQLFKSLEFFSITEKEIHGSVKLNIPTGKIPIYANGLIVGYKDVHNSLIRAIKQTPILGIASKHLRKIIKYADKAINKLSPKDE